MPEPERRRVASGSARAAAWLAVAVILAGLLLLLGAYLLHKEKPIAGTPAPRALFHATNFTLHPRQSACMNSVTLPPNGRTLQLLLGEAPSATNGNPPIDVVLSAPGYRSVARLPAGQGEGQAELFVRPPKHFVVGSICLINRGTSPAVLLGSTEQRSRTRSTLTIDGKAVEGDIALTFVGNHGKTRLSRLGEAFEHASNLTDRLIPDWLVWLIAVFVALSLPVATIAFFYRALREDEVA
jgi:hypothetical protein